MSSPAFIFLHGGGVGAQLDYMSQLSLRLSVQRDRELTNRDVGKSDFQAPLVQYWRWGGAHLFFFWNAGMGTTPWKNLGDHLLQIEEELIKEGLGP